VGYQYFPKTKSVTDTDLKMGMPSANRKRAIRKRVVMEARATPKKTNRMVFSLF